MSSNPETVLLVRHCNACGHEWIRHRGCTSWHGFHTCEACASENVQTVKECTESQYRAVAYGTTQRLSFQIKVF